MAVAKSTVDQPGDTAIEQWLNGLRVAWTFEPAVALSSIDRAAGITNQARLQPLDDEVVDRYTAAMQHGDTFPPILLNRKGRRLVPLGGNHRVAAAGQAKRAALAAYIVTADGPMATRLMFEDNRRHGLAPADDERCLQAVHLVNNGYTQSDAADVVGLPRHKVDMAVNSQRATVRAKTLGVAGWDRLPKTVRWRLGALRSDPVFAEAARLMADGALRSGDTFEMVSALGKTRSDTEALELLASFAEQHHARIQATAGGKAVRNTPRSKLLATLTGIRMANPAEVRAACADLDQRRQLARSCIEAADRLADLAKELTRR